MSSGVTPLFVDVSFVGHYEALMIDYEHEVYTHAQSLYLTRVYKHVHNLKILQPESTEVESVIECEQVHVYSWSPSHTQSNSQNISFNFQVYKHNSLTVTQSQLQSSHTSVYYY